MIAAILNLSTFGDAGADNLDFVPWLDARPQRQQPQRLAFGMEFDEVKRVLQTGVEAAGTRLAAASAHTGRPLGIGIHAQPSPSSAVAYPALGRYIIHHRHAFIKRHA